MSTFEEALGDSDSALVRHKQARWAEDVVAAQRRTLNDVMGCMCRLRNYWSKRLGPRYFELVADSHAGRITEALVLVRGAGDHDFSRDVAPHQRYAYPGPRTFLSPNLFPGDRSLYWRARQELDYDLSERDRHGRVADYDELVAGFLVPDTLDAARHFLASPASAAERG